MDPFAVTFLAITIGLLIHKSKSMETRIEKLEHNEKAILEHYQIDMESILSAKSERDIERAKAMVSEDRIGAMYLYRKAKGCSLREAKEFIDELHPINK